ncbi:unnamed protein product [Phytomonas sp. EM1]|nr:unnamed protein product [Phytomonas sp. EM1]|eukprot:CCW61434.1 unnamed protein product [Phytomonas sp. isolate EM1]
MNNRSSRNRPQSPADELGLGHIDASSTSHDLPTNSNKSIVWIVKKIVLASIPLGFAAVSQISIGALSVATVGRMVGVTQLGATSLAFGLINATSFAFGSGFSGALETVLSSSYGRNPTNKLYGIYAQRMVLLLLATAFFIGPILAFSDSLLIAIGQNPQVSYYTGVFLRVAIFGTYPMMILEVVRRYYACQHLNSSLSVSMILNALLFFLVLWTCIKLFGFIGAAIAWNFLMVFIPLSLIIYLRFTGKYKKTWGGWREATFHNWTPLLRLAIPSMIVVLSEWVSLEINGIVAGFAPENDLAAFGIWYQLSSILWSFVSGVFIMAAVLVGNAIGQGNNHLARRCACISLVVGCAFSMFNIMLVICFSRYIPRIFSDNDDVASIFLRIKWWWITFHFFDCFQSCMMGILRGCGQQLIGSFVIALVYSVVGVPLGITLFFKTSMGVKALWMGPAIGVSCVGFPVYLYLFFYHIDWDKLTSINEELPALSTRNDRLSTRAPFSTKVSDIDIFQECESNCSTCPASSSHPFESRNVSISNSEHGEFEHLSFASHLRFASRDILSMPQSFYMHSADNQTEAPILHNAVKSAKLN